ncbi:DUF3179 domain-containing protein [Chloroflexi bacterium TSY]|nr:DUF3179 domain-containing protein [Chloroflexi bacterium TSY]
MIVVVGCAPLQQHEALEDEGSPKITDLSNEAIDSGNGSYTHPPIVVPDAIPDVDTSRHSVPLETIIFDTFQPTNRAVPLTDASPELIVRLRDAIPPIHAPIYETANDATWLTDDDGVIGYAVGDQAWAYPIRILNFHEIVNDVLANEPVLISYCPLCYSGIVYSRQLDDRVLTFGNTSALHESDMVMLDYETGSYWWQVAGRAIVGELTDAQMMVLPSMTTRWKQWRALHPDTLVLSRQTGHNRDYGRNPFVGIEEYLNTERFLFPVSEAGLDKRLLPGTKVLVVQRDDETRAYPIQGETSFVIADMVGQTDVVVFVDPANESAAVFEINTDSATSNFIVKDGRFMDTETNSVWDLAGRAVDGPLSGEQLDAVASKTTFWFAAVASEPSITVADIPF